jgi:hypothetical protein
MTTQSEELEELKELVTRLRRAYDCISDILVYSPDYMHGLPKSDYSEALHEAVSWLELRYGKEKIKRVKFSEIDAPDETLL